MTVRAPGELMKVLIADDDPLTRELVEHIISRDGFETEVVCDGAAAYERLVSDESIHIAVVDWMMPDLDGLELCRRVRASPRQTYVFLLLLTARSRPDDVLAGLAAGADDFVTKPFDARELCARVRVGARVATLEASLRNKVIELEDSSRRVRRLEGIIPVCMHCKRIREGKDSWRKMEEYLRERSDARVTHGVCLECLDRHYPEAQPA